MSSVFVGMNAPDIQPVHEAPKKVDEKRNKNSNLSDTACEGDDSSDDIMSWGSVRRGALDDHRCMPF